MDVSVKEVVFFDERDIFSGLSSYAAQLDGEVLGAASDFEVGAGEVPAAYLVDLGFKHGIRIISRGRYRRW